jgi:PAS domain-containing protein
MQVEKLTQGWLRDREKRGYGRDLEFMDWAAQTAERAKETLIHLLRKYQIQPFDILEILAHSKSEEWFHTHLTVRKKLRSFEHRERDAKSLEKAILVLDQWRSYLIQETNAIEWNHYPEIATLELVAKVLRDLGPSQKHRATEVRLRCCAQWLAEIMKHHARWDHPLYEHIGYLVKAAFPKDWNPAGDIREAAKKLVKGWDYRKRWIDQQNYPIWIVDNRVKIVHVNQPAGRLLRVRPWEAIGKDVNFLVKPLFARFRENGDMTQRTFQGEYSKVLTGKRFEWKTTLTLEREVMNKFYEKEKQFIKYDVLVQREIGSGANAGIMTYLTERKT